MNTFNITLGMFTEDERATGCVLSFRGAAAGHVEIWARAPKPNIPTGKKPAGQGEPQFEDVCLGRVLVANLTMTIAAVQTLTGGHCG